ncbi:thioredoxin-like domain-containing protein [Daldinia decipiens]|uniref:thioredoxin-like domain-containing protein n=1 Tax=Daldinia decipiens TaxID=326647 RepID=UPI0020C2BBA3|nr:thioredoxin-like domain-containing protein [Daldinia decipiens]KAI1654522.1 thioredoxin-like domain-containing protein [Daldinia decipiens]
MSRLATILLCVYTLFFSIAHTWEHLSESDLESMLNNNEAATPLDKRTEHLETEWSLTLPEAKVSFVSIDCTANAAICASHGISSSTTVKLFSKGKLVSVYAGPRRASALLAWADRVQRPVISDVNAASLEDFRKADETVFIVYLSTDDEASKAAFANVAGRYHEEFTFGVATDDDALEAEKVTAPAVKCYKPVDGDTHDFNSLSDTTALEAFVKEASRPVIGELLPHNHQRFLDRGWSMVYVFAATEVERAGIRKDLNKMARGNYKSLTMVTVDPYEFPDLPAKLGLDPNVLPAGAVHQLSKDRIYPYPKGKGWTSSEVQGWGLDVWQGRIKPWTPPGVTTTYDDLGGRIKATQKISMRKIPGVKIKIAGRDEL